MWGRKGKKSYSSYWIGDYAMQELDGEITDVERLMKFSNIRKGIADFVRIVTDTAIPVRFSSGEQSYTDGEKIVVISASDNPDYFDCMVGLACHEASHIVLSQPLFRLTEEMGLRPERYISPELKTLGAKLNRDEKKIVGDIHGWLNFLEDRRIDDWMYRKTPGYRPYYESRYEKHFYSPMIDVALSHPTFREPFLKSYEMHIINMFNELADPDALPGLREIWNVVDLANISRYDNDNRWEPWAKMAPRATRMWAKPVPYPIVELPLIVQDALKITQIIYENAALAPSTQQDMNESGTDSHEMDMSAGESYDNLENYDMPDNDAEEKEGEGKEKDGDSKEKNDVSKMKKALRRQKKFLGGDTQKKEMDSGSQDNINSLDASDAEMRSAGDVDSRNAKCKVIVYKNVTEQTLQLPATGFSRMNYTNLPETCQWSVEAIKEGKRVGAILAHRIRVMNDESTTTFSRQRHGKLDKRLVASLGFENEYVFSQQQVVKLAPVMVDVSVDASGSMAGVKWQKAMTLATALAITASKIRSMRIRINLRTTSGDTAVVAIIYDSTKNNVSQIDKIFPFLWPDGGTPEGLCYEAIRKELLENVKQTRKYFVNLSDGEPAFYWNDSNSVSHQYSGVAGVAHTRRQVQDILEMGTKVLAYFITAGGYGSSKSQFQEMYGKDAAFINPDNIVEICTTLNRLFMSA